MLRDAPRHVRRPVLHAMCMCHGTARCCRRRASVAVLCGSAGQAAAALPYCDLPRGKSTSASSAPPLRAVACTPCLSRRAVPDAWLPARPPARLPACMPHVGSCRTRLRKTPSVAARAARNVKPAVIAVKPHHLIGTLLSCLAWPARRGQGPAYVPCAMPSRLVEGRWGGQPEGSGLHVYVCMNRSATRVFQVVCRIWSRFRSSHLMLQPVDLGCGGCMLSGGSPTRIANLLYVAPHTVMQLCDWP